MAFTLISGARHSLHRTTIGGTSNDAAGFASRYGPLSRSPYKGFRHWASTPDVSLRRRQPATGPPGSYPDRTHTGKRRRAYDQRSTTSSTSRLLGARKLAASCHRRAVNEGRDILGLWAGDGGDGG
jgi:hypothetical protein